MSGQASSDPVSSLQSTLAAEHAAVWLYGVLAAQTSQSTEEQLWALLADGFTLHRDRRDELELRLRDLDQTPEAAAPAYELPERLGSADERSAAAARIERGCAGAYADLVANSSGQGRGWAVEALTSAAVREVELGGTATPFPGAGDLAR